MRREVPSVLWVGLIALALISVVQFVLGVAQGNLPLLIGVVLNLVFLFGLYRGRRWAFVATLAFAALGFLVALSRNAVGGLAVLVATGYIAVPVILARDYFWSPRARPAVRTPNYCGRCGHSLRGVTDLNCPNCGIEIRPADGRVTG